MELFVKLRFLYSVINRTDKVKCNFSLFDSKLYSFLEYVLDAGFNWIWRRFHLFVHLHLRTKTKRNNLRTRNCWELKWQFSKRWKLENSNCEVISNNVLRREPWDFKFLPSGEIQPKTEWDFEEENKNQTFWV